MKKISMTVCMLFLMSIIAGAVGNFEADTFSFKYDKEKLSEMRKDYNAYKRELRNFIEKYNKAEDKEKTAIKGDITRLVSGRTDKELASRKELVADIGSVIREIETNKSGYVSKKVDFMLSPAGQKALKNNKDKKAKTKK
ncbi:MAG: hypothetical protein LBV16_05925 [Elusimicrobiota bacterium]|nr:hypothetical protein [Elusimicrobiota bacterium]